MTENQAVKMTVEKKMVTQLPASTEEKEVSATFLV